MYCMKVECIFNNNNNNNSLSLCLHLCYPFLAWSKNQTLWNANCVYVFCVSHSTWVSANAQPGANFPLMYLLVLFNIIYNFNPFSNTKLKFLLQKNLQCEPLSLYSYEQNKDSIFCIFPFCCHSISSFMHII